MTTKTAKLAGRCIGCAGQRPALTSPCSPRREFPPGSPTFVNIDFNCNGGLVIPEMVNFLSSNKDLNAKQRQGMSKGMMQNKDADKNGEVTWDEFKPPKKVSEV